jgi:hypothetical protein
MYVVHTSFDTTTLTPTYSTPTFLGVFLLPDPFTSRSVIFSISPTDGSQTSVTTSLALTLNPAINGINFDDVIISDSVPASGIALQTINSSDGLNYTLSVNNGSTSSLITKNRIIVALTRVGYSFTPVSAPVDVFLKANAVDFTSISASPLVGSSTTITMTFDPPVFGLVIGDISVSSGAVTTLDTTDGSTYTLGVTGASVGDLDVSIINHGSIFNPSNLNVNISN